MSDTLVCFWRYEAPEHEDALPDYDGNVYGRGHPGKKTHLIGLLLFFLGVLGENEAVAFMMGGNLHACFSMVFFLLRRNKHVRRNREFETSKGLTHFFIMPRSMHHTMLLTGSGQWEATSMSWAFVNSF